MAYHRPVLLNECIEGLNIKPKGIYVDLTFGGGGHSRLLLEKLDKKGRLFAFDQDPDAEQNIIKDKRLTFIPANFRFMQNFLRYYEISQVDGILADLGISSHQIDEAGRGFTFRNESELDMRMNPSSQKSAFDVLNHYDASELHRVFRTYGEIQGTGKLVQAIIEARNQEKIRTSVQLESILAGIIPRQQRSKFLAKLYQAIRIEVNDEMGALEEMLPQTGERIATGGRLVVITYHSLEDRMVKNFMRTGNTEGNLEKDFYGNTLSPWIQVNRRVITPAEDEIQDNPRSRSAKLRIAERKE